MLLPLALIVDRPWTLPMPSAATVAAVLALALLSTALGYIIYFRLLAAAGATNLLLVTFLIPVSAILLGATVLGERGGDAEGLVWTTLTDPEGNEFCVAEH
jgi:drug/metabolite transporter (DMT)-like permease